MLNRMTTEKSMPIRRLQTGWLEAGERGRPVLFFCHGFPDGPDIWSHQIEALAKDYRIIVPYVRGCLVSEPAADLNRYSRDSIALDHLSILSTATEGHEPVFVIGHDLGAVHAFTLGRRIGERLSGLIIINGLDLEMFARRLKDPAQVARSWYMGLMQLPIIPETIVKFAPHTAAWLTQTLAGGQQDGYLASDFEQRAMGPLNQYRAFARESLVKSSVLVRIAAPVLVLWGRDDGVLLPPTQAEWDAVALDATIRIIPGGHWLHRDQHENITAFIRSFATDQKSEATYVE